MNEVAREAGVPPGTSAILQPVDQIAVTAWRSMPHQIGKRTIAVAPIRAGTHLVVRQFTTGRETEAL